VNAEGTAAMTAQQGPATVVVAQPVKRGREQDIRRWQDDVNRAVGEFAGYLGNDIASAADGNGDQWTVIYRFDSKPHLMSWLKSPERAAVLGRGAELFAGPASQHVLIREDDADMVTVVVAHPVEPADEEAFLTWQGRVTDAEKQFPGFRGAELFRPVPGVQPEWTALYRYDTDEHATAWLESDERKKLLAEGKRFKDFELHRISSPFGSWFAPPGGDKDGEQGPPNWKTGLSVLVGLYPTVVLLTLAISNIWPSASLWQSLLLGNICSVSLLTWVVMPLVTRALRFWLVPRRDGPGVRIDVLGAAVSVGFLTFAATIFWLITTQVWHLP
jgi:antibiotic biosynthesis monooxygenase (ABM) superfamily enzyme